MAYVIKVTGHSLLDIGRELDMICVNPAMTLIDNFWMGNLHIWRSAVLHL